MRRLLFTTAFPAFLAAAVLAAGCASASPVAPQQQSDGRAAAQDSLPPPEASGQAGATAYAQQRFVRGLVRAELEDYDAAIRFYEEALRAAPGEAAILSALAGAHAAQDGLTAARYYARQARQAAPENTFYYFQEADLHREAGDAEEALATYRALLAQAPQNAEARFAFARTQVEAGRLNEALATYEALLERVGETPEIRTRMLELQRRLGDEAGMERTLEALIAEEPEESLFRRLLSALYQQQGRPAEAVRQLEAALEEDPNDLEAALALVELYRATGRSDEAEALLSRSLGAENASTAQLVERAATLLARAERDPAAAEAAERLLRQALDKDPDHAEALGMLGDLRFRAGAYAEAAPLLTRALEENPRSPERWFRAAAAHLQSGAARQAADVASEGLLLFDGQLPLVRVAAYALMDAGQNAAAARRFEEAVALLEETSTEGAAAERADLLASLGLLHNRTGDAAASDSAYARALALNPDHALALNNYAYNLAERGESLDRALTMARRAVELDPESASFLDTLGWVYFKRGNLDEAARWIEKAVATGEASAAVYEHRGDVAAAQGRSGEAQRFWEMALEKSPDRPTLRQKLGRPAPENGGQ